VLKGRKLVDVGIFRRLRPKQHIGFCLTKTSQNFLKNQAFFPKPATTLGLRADKISIFSKISTRKSSRKLNFYQYFSQLKIVLFSYFVVAKRLRKTEKTSNSRRHNENCR